MLEVDLCAYPIRTDLSLYDKSPDVMNLFTQLDLDETSAATSNLLSLSPVSTTSSVSNYITTTTSCLTSNQESSALKILDENVNVICTLAGLDGSKLTLIDNSGRSFCIVPTNSTTLPLSNELPQQQEATTTQDTETTEQQEPSSIHTETTNLQDTSAIQKETAQEQHQSAIHTESTQQQEETVTQDTETIEQQGQP
ncbi:MAG: hypothetical protein N0E48_20120, partial [Candidatus Thiodiazotropha endolucinida]|nr:hypothetical protein [Candidatus Thiodiazotropha taylori]MCW4345642.1 hypothetical protein [Candidatus Thiodiazotropha endolucinida]